MAKKKSSAAEVDAPVEERLKITPPNMKIAVFDLVGTSPLVQCAFGKKAAEQMAEAQRAGETGRKKRKRTPKDFDAAYKEAMHISDEGWHGHPASAWRQALVSACRSAGFAMTISKQALFVEGDGIDRVSGMPLVRIYGKPEYFEAPVRLKKAGSFDIRARPMFKDWRVKLRLRYDADLFTLDDVANLLMRAGLQVGIGEGRADSKDSVGCGWGFFEFSSEAKSERRTA